MIIRGNHGHRIKRAQSGRQNSVFSVRSNLGLLQHKQRFPYFHSLMAHGMQTNIVAQTNTLGGSPDAPPARSASEDGRSCGEAAALRLENRTYSDAPINARNRITLRNYGNGLTEVGWSFVGLNPNHKAARGSSIQRTQNEDRAVRRAISRLRQLALSASLTPAYPHLSRKRD